MRVTCQWYCVWCMIHSLGSFFNSFVMNLVSFPTYVNFAHFIPVLVLLFFAFGGMSILDVSYLLTCRMCLIIFLSLSLLSILRWYLFILFVRYLTAAILCSVGWHESEGIMESVAVRFLYTSKTSLSFSFSIVKRLRWCRGSVLASDTQVRGFKPGRSRWIFKGR